MLHRQGSRDDLEGTEGNEKNDRSFTKTPVNVC